MKYFLFATALLLTSATISEDYKIKGIAIVHFNAKFNEANNYEPVEKLKDVKVVSAWIDDDASIKAAEGIRSVPTLILYKNGKEIKRWEAGLSLSLDVPFKEIQKEVDKLTGANKF